VSYAPPPPEPRKLRLLRLMLLQIAILSVANGCRHEAREAHDSNEPQAQPAPRHRYVEGRFVPENLVDSLDRMSQRGANGRSSALPVKFELDRRPLETFGELEHTATSRLDTGRLAELAP
jgi:hypothetical protein